MKDIFALIALLALIHSFSHGQSAPIAIDGVFEDWSENLVKLTDAPESLQNINLLEVKVTNDADWLYISIVTDKPFDLSDDLIDHDIRLYIDTDNNPSTGQAIQAQYGADVELSFSNRGVDFKANTNLNFNDLQMRSAPTVTSNRFEIALKRDNKPDGVNALFPNDKINILWANFSNGDRLPNVGSSLVYTFDETDVPVIEPVTIEKSSVDDIRIAVYNTLFDGLTNQERLPHFERIVKGLNPDIIGFSECNSVSANQVKILMDDWLPIGADGWYVEKHSNHGLITASRWPILNRWQTLERQFPTLIDLPERYEKDLLFTNAHLKCCDGEEQRQRQADQYIQFILDAKTTGGVVDLPKNTPFVYGGDLNLVGFAQQLNTLITGDIQDELTYGPAAFPDWDNTSVADLISYQTENRQTFTWKSDRSSFPAGKLDFMLYSDAVMSVQKSFVLRTEIIPISKLRIYGLEQNDTEAASDHFPVVADFSIETKTGNLPQIKKNRVEVFPNPSNGKLQIRFSDARKRQIEIYDANGRLHLNVSCTNESLIINCGHLHKGVYTVKCQEMEGALTEVKWVKV